jgi:F-type H+-transporting ATPase subunit epsilon
MELEILTPSKKLFSGKIKLVKLPGANGSFEILNNHAPIISTLEKGQIKVIDLQNEVLFFDINNGVIEASNNKIVVLVGSI